jgi:predicted nucleotidyltransferase
VTSATSIREIIKTGKVKKLKKNLPDFTYRDLTEYPVVFDTLTMGALARSTADELAEILDCTEGLENRLKALAKDNTSLTALTEKAVTKRYSLSRINRILISNLLGIKASLVKDAIKNPPYAKVLAVSSDKKELISLIAKESSIPVLTRKSDTAS